jgi:dihydroxyacetone kinase-like predicted kinase
MITKYELEFILHAKDSSPKMIKSSLSEFGNNLVVSPSEDNKEGHNYKVNMVTEEPTLVFDLCSQLGRIRSVKVKESHFG